MLLLAAVAKIKHAWHHLAHHNLMQAASYSAPIPVKICWAFLIHQNVLERADLAPSALAESCISLQIGKLPVSQRKHELAVHTHSCEASMAV